MGSLPWLHHESAVNGGRAGHTVGSLGIWVPRSGSYGRYTWASAEVVNVWDWLQADGEVEARSLIEGLDEDSEDRVSLCWGAVPWLKDISPVAWEVCESVGWGGGQAFVQVDSERGVREILMIAPSSRAHLQGSWLCVQPRQGCCVGELAEAWMESFESVIEEEGWSIEGDEGDGSQGWLIPPSFDREEEEGY
jgi:hypothetical protein